MSGWGVETRQLWGESGAATGTVISGILGSEVTAQKRDLERLRPRDPSLGGLLLGPKGIGNPLEVCDLREAEACVSPGNPSVLLRAHSSRGSRCLAEVTKMQLPVIVY